MKVHYNLYLFVSVLFVVGGVFGILLVHALTLEQQQNVTEEVRQYVQSIYAGMGASPEAVFWSKFFFHLKWLVLILLLGITVIGIPGILALNFLKGALIGFALGILIKQYEWKGIFFSLVTMAPQNTFAVPALIMMSAASISFGLFIVRNRLLQQKGDLLPPLGALASTAIIILLLYAGAAFIEAYFSPAVISWAAPYLASQSDPH